MTTVRTGRARCSTPATAPLDMPCVSESSTAIPSNDSDLAARSVLAPFGPSVTPFLSRLVSRRRGVHVV